MAGLAGNVRYRVKSGKHLLGASISAFDPTETLGVHCGNGSWAAKMPSH
jgi:hypothetical protein